MSRLTGLMPAPPKALIALVVLWALMAAAVVVVLGFGAGGLMSEPTKGWWACSVCRQRSDDFEPARGPGNRRGATFVVALPCGHQNPKGLTWHETPTREAAPLLCGNCGKEMASHQMPMAECYPRRTP